MTHTLGVDISKQWLDTFDQNTQKARRFPNTAQGHAACLAWAQSQSSVPLIVFEATGIYHVAFERCLGRARQPFAKVNPRHAKQFSQALGRSAKTDALDAQMLARMGAALALAPSQVHSDLWFDLRALRSARRSLTKDIVAAKTRLRNAQHDLVARQLRAHLRRLQADLAEIDQTLDHLIHSEPDARARHQILTSIPGIGALTATALLIEMPELGQMTARQAGALAGLAPMTRSSGKWQGRAFIRHGRAELRRAIYMPALVAIRHNPTMHDMYEKMINAGKPAKVAIIAVMRKLIVLANALLAKDRKWLPTPP